MEISYASPSAGDLTYSSFTSSGSSMPNRPVKIIPLQHPDTTSYGSSGGGSSSSSSSSSSSFWSNSLFSGWGSKIRQMTIVDWIGMCFPCFRWIRTYRWREYLQVDLMAGTTVGIMLVPQAMSYAKLAGLEPIYGLYSGFVPIFIYAIFGSSRQLAIGPVALVSLLVSNVLSGIADSSDALYTELAILLALMVGILECIMGLLRLGWLIRFISHSVISGFTTASAIVIALSQAKYFLGYDIERSSEIVPIIKSIISGADEFSWPPFVMGSIILIILQTMKHLGKSRKHLRFLRAMGPLTAVVLGTTFVKIYHPSSITLVGDIPQGLPSFSIPRSFKYAKSLIPTTLLITGVAILESVGIAKALAAKNGYELDSNQELFGLGVANIFGSFFSAYPTTGSFSRSAVNHESGAKSGLSGIVTGIIMGCALLFLTPLFEYIPQCALAAIVISAVISLVDYEEAIFLWRVDKKDFLLWTITSTTTLFLGIEIGVLVGVGVSLAFVIHESANPHIAVLGRLPGTTVYRNIQQYPEAYTYNGIVIVRIDAPIYFANISYIKDRLREYEVVVDKSTRRGPEVERIYFVILEMAPVTYIDSSAVQALKDLHHEYKSRDIQIAISNPNREVLLTLSKSRAVELIGKEWYFVRVHDAVQVCLQHVQSIKEVSKTSDPSPEEKPSFFQRFLKQRGEDVLVASLESGSNSPSDSTHSDPQLEPLLFRKP
ncbi:PREDICTED: sulfate transporter 4.1, chloroplastic isoform X1 [Theobroma cacao]|uniref:Sulfate transporter 4.1, chloroplastic isoform X1 n=2 Tax=Theobroma cacao TaxID=3641 RepID=A0AB32ULL7_THECC|nr:PREDICTED: sulfate transporter 4.1, chloroplastic isoform X1 [Theobroma cacao]